MFTVNLYTLSKRENSTKRPDSAPASFSCIIKEPSGLISPVIVLDLGLSADPSGYNYAYIPDFGRYYFVEEWTFERAVWSASLTCDVLATYRGEIGDTTAYVLRAAADSDGNVVDNMYPITADTTFSRKTASNPFWSGSLTGGCYVVGIVARDASHGSVQYWAMTPGNLRALCTALMADIVTGMNGFDAEDASFALQKALVDPFQFIKSCVWVPFSADSVGQPTAQNLIVYDYGFNSIYGHDLPINSAGTKTGSISFTGIARHPQAARGNYMNLSPYTEAELYIPPFGIIQLDTRLLAESPSVTCNYNFDCITGNCILEVTIGGSVTNRVSAQVGVPVQLSQVRTDIMGIATSAGGMIANAAVGNVMGALSGVGSAIQAMIPRASTIGSAGGWADLLGTPSLNQYFHTVTDDDPDHAGRPLMKSRRLSTLPGYQLIQDGDIAIAGTAAEAAAVRAYLEGGYYYE